MEISDVKTNINTLDEKKSLLEEIGIWLALTLHPELVEYDLVAHANFNEENNEEINITNGDEEQLQ